MQVWIWSLWCTGADALNQNGLVECAHCTIFNSIWALLFSSGLSAHFWPYAFNHVLRIWNALPHCGQDKSSLQHAHGRKDNFKNLKTFGCRIHVQLPDVYNKKNSIKMLVKVSFSVRFHILTNSLFGMMKILNVLKLLPILKLMKVLMISWLIIYLLIVNIFYNWMVNVSLLIKMNL